GDGGIGAVESGGEIGSQGADGENPPAGAHQLAFEKAGAGMEDLDAGQGARAVEAADGFSMERPAGIAGARQDDASRDLAAERVPAGIEMTRGAGGEHR